MSTKPEKTETLEHREMFEYYYGLGNTRSMKTVAAHFKKGIATVKRYARDFNWSKRVEQRDNKNADAMAKATDAAMVASKSMYRETIGMLVSKFRQDVLDGKIKIRGILDFERIVNIDLALMGDDMVNAADNMKSLVDSMQSSMAMHGTSMADLDKEFGEQDGGENDEPQAH